MSWDQERDTNRKGSNTNRMNEQEQLESTWLLIPDSKSSPLYITINTPDPENPRESKGGHQKHQIAELRQKKQKNLTIL